jgi:hypothetical protein
MGSVPFLGIDNINSGCTFKSHFNRGPIIIWRREECEKVLVHELCHFFDMDFCNLDTLQGNRLLKQFDIPNNDYLHIFESITELWALIFNTIFNLKLENIKGIDKIILRLKLESIFSYIQICKILFLYGYKSYEYDFFNYTINSKRFQQGTSVFAYFFLKLVLLVNLDNFFEYISIKSNIRKIWSYRGISQDLEDFLFNLVNKPDFTNCMNTFFKEFKCKENNLRMSLF